MAAPPRHLQVTFVKNKMNLFRLFRKPTKTEIYRQIANEIILNALFMRLEIVDESPSASDRVGREIAFFHLYRVDLCAFTELGTSGRNDLIGNVCPETASRYVEAILTKEAPSELLRNQRSAFIQQYNYRADIYGHCRVVTSGPYSESVGSEMFAFTYFLHIAISGDYGFDATDILCGRRKIEMSDMKHFPPVEKQMMWKLLRLRFMNEKLLTLIRSSK